MIDKPRLKCNLINRFHCHSPLHFNPLDWNCSTNPWCCLFKMLLVDNFKVQHLLMKKQYKRFHYILHFLWIVEAITNLVFNFWNDGHKYEGEIYECIKMNMCICLICLVCRLLAFEKSHYMGGKPLLFMHIWRVKASINTNDFKCVVKNVYIKNFKCVNVQN